MRAIKCNGPSNWSSIGIKVLEHAHCTLKHNCKKPILTSLMDGHVNHYIKLQYGSLKG